MFRSSSGFDKLLDKATSNLRLEPDWPTILQICDQIRQGDVQPKYALAAIKKKLYNANPHIAMFGLLVLESCVKNCGHLIHDEIGTKQYMEQLRELVKTTNHENVKNKVLEMIQAWAYAFRNSPKYRAVQDTLNIMKTEGYKFPVLKESDAMFSADTAPEWADGDCCHRCRVSFGVVQRKHHCRACGQVFCSQCSSKTSTLPKFGIEKEVRVCEACYESLNKSTSTPPPTQKSEGELPPEYLSSSLAQQSQGPPRKTEEELREEEELQLALALSKSEAEHKEKEKKRTTSAIISNAAAIQRAKQYSPPPLMDNSPNQGEEEDPELARYLNRAYWEKRQNEDSSGPSTSASSERSSPRPGQQPSAPSPRIQQKQENGEPDSQIEEFVGALKSQVEIFVNRMKSNSSRGRSIANDSSVQTLFMNITAMHSQLLRYIQQQDDSRVYYEGLQDKLAQVKDARAALDALREEHREKLRRQAEEAERIRQLQMAHKLEIMRKKKQEYLQYQRQLALQRIQEQEREMQMRQEQQKQQYMRGSLPYGMPPYVGAPGPHQTYPPSGPESSPVHTHYGPPSMPPGGQMFTGAPPPVTTGAPVQGPQSFQEYPHYTLPGIPAAQPHSSQPVPVQGPPGPLPQLVRPQQGALPGGVMPPMGPIGPHGPNQTGPMPLPGQGVQGQMQPTPPFHPQPNLPGPPGQGPNPQIQGPPLPIQNHISPGQFAPGAPQQPPGSSSGSPQQQQQQPQQQQQQQQQPAQQDQKQDQTAELISFD
ncbi:hepatocyte growth factor-regulated tyrosine kinase substrate [Schistocerca cancellata]|uniref:hepatocyte growth factor-regulated tyrosine kinase substrate n=1 Tax=Schistocerca cancellata TaxID=274614 RepID=UPI0021182F4A|nr:hepatocyte growth factor-regulated tyrosine kinase substrate [Schistocerca cancellata]